MLSTSRRFASLLWLAFALSSPAEVRSDDGYRPYSAGPLTADDFRAEAPKDTKKYAFTSTELRFTYQFRTSSENGETSGYLTKISIQAYVRRDKCWNRKPEDKALLDHEQGHFDIAEIHARRARAEAAKGIAEKSFQATGKNGKEVQAALAEQILALTRKYEEAMQTDDARYDEKTAHGLAVESQREWRRVHFETLRALEEAKPEENAGKSSRRGSQ